MDQIKAVYQGNFDLLENIQVSPLSRAYTFSDSIYEVIPFLMRILFILISILLGLKEVRML